LLRILDLQCADNRKSRLIDASQSNVYRRPLSGEPLLRAQTAIYEYCRSLTQTAPPGLRAENGATEKFLNIAGEKNSD
jgi:hypothetical protein